MPPKRKSAPPKKAPPKKAPRDASLPEARAREAIAREEAVPGAGDRVRLTLRLVLSRQDAEALAARAIREEKNLPALVEEILEAEAARGE
jgi:hypothetical protein